MQKAANLILFITIFLFINGASIKEVSSTIGTYDTETTLNKYIKFLEYREIDRRAIVEKRLYDSLIAKPSVEWLLTGFTERQIKIESGGNQEQVGREGELGVAQFLPSTWNSLVAKNYLPTWFNIRNEKHQRIAQLVYLDHLYSLWYKYPSEERKALTAASYNAGPGRILEVVKRCGSTWRDSIPNSTIKYLKALKSYI